ncbi:NAD(P)H-hydrate dehydratase [Methylicorpusculum oleiharenae]|uniref:NAD(P)H-hydrate dehydratase n=1 Tax=Methylicorpusculum oleiharenae TaxID=1338687 RepID=UPI00135710B9|nr:NAD(P)H-hydrate dehydratase [Methylicorpusculum oleiharenae]MCD2448947.1 NAD(P)H-hydrate dehydratase [Methylicorpusculum oleiharenae]
MQDLPIELYRVNQVRTFDRIAIEEYGITGYELMSRAGDFIFNTIVSNCPDCRNWAVFCGGGNNGGDGYVVARLALEAGINACVYPIVDGAALKGDARLAFEAYTLAGGIFKPFTPDSALETDLIVDALLGSGLDRPVSGLYAKAINAINASASPVIAADIPSGLNADTGKVMGEAVKADYTVSLVGLKQGLFTGDAADFCGTILFSDLDIPQQVYERQHCSARRLMRIPFARRSRCAHKGVNGHVLIVGGDYGFSGAVRLAAEAALRIGAGLVTVATRPEHALTLNLDRPEIMCHGISDAYQLSERIKRASVIVLGPGLGSQLWGRSLFDAVLQSDKPIVMDADGLTILSRGTVHRDNWVLTPHPGEASRLLTASIAAIEADRFYAVSEMQKAYGGIVVLKGAGSLVANKTDIAISPTGNPGMASGGMGDVLSGVIGGLIAQGLSLQTAAEQGVYIHGLAGDLAAQAGGERGLLAGDLMSYLRQLVNE